jgi:hypothetical protein
MGGRASSAAGMMSSASSCSSVRLCSARSACTAAASSTNLPPRMPRDSCGGAGAALLRSTSTVPFWRAPRRSSLVRCVGLTSGGSAAAASAAASAGAEASPLAARQPPPVLPLIDTLTPRRIDCQPPSCAARERQPATDLPAMVSPSALGGHAVVRFGSGYRAGVREIDRR